MTSGRKDRIYNIRKENLLNNMKLLIQRLDISKRKKEELKRKDVKLRKELIKYSSNKNILRMN